MKDAMRPLLGIIILFVAGVLLQQRALPFMEGGDEWQHYNYVQWLRETSSLPDRSSSATNSTQQASGQPPLYYAVNALALDLLGLPVTDGDALHRHLYDERLNPWYTAPDLWHRGDNRNLFVHDPQQQRPADEAASQASRLVSLFFGLVSVSAAYGIGRELFAQRSWAIMLAGVFALTPMFVHLNSFTRNDSAAIAGATLLLWQALRTLRRAAPPADILLLGLLIGLAGLAKINALPAAAAGGLAVLLAWRSHPRSRSLMLRDSLLLCLPVVLIFGSWVLYGWLNFADPLGTNTHNRPGYYYENTLNLPQMISLLPNVYVSYWAQLGSASYLHPVSYSALGLIALVSLGAYASRLRRRPALSTHQWRQASLIGAFALLALLALAYWLRSVRFVTGHVIYPAHILFAIGLTGGLYLLAQRFPRQSWLIRAACLCILATTSILAAPLTLTSSYVKTLNAADTLPTLAGPVVDFDQTIRLLGHEQASPILGSKMLHRVSVCWQVLAATSRPAAYSLRIVDTNGQELGQRTTIHGLGRYNSGYWQPGDTFCDEVDIPITTAPEASKVYSLLIAMLDARTQDFDWQASDPAGQPIDYAFIGELISPAGQQPLPESWARSNIQFPNFARLQAYQLSGEALPGASLALELFWQVDQQTPDRWSQFFHLYRIDQQRLSDPIILADGPTRGGSYPTDAWQAGENLQDSWTLLLPADLPPGTYRLYTGLYREGIRMPVTENSLVMPDGAAPLLTITTGDTP